MKLQGSTSNIQRNYKARTSNFANLVLEYSLVPGCWGLDVATKTHALPIYSPHSVSLPAPTGFPLSNLPLHRLSTINHSRQSHLCGEYKIAKTSASKISGSQRFAILLKVNKGKHAQKKFRIFFGLGSKKSLGNPATIAKNNRSNLREKHANFDAKNRAINMRKKFKKSLAIASLSDSLPAPFDLIDNGQLCLRTDNRVPPGNGNDGSPTPKC